MVLQSLSMIPCASQENYSLQGHVACLASPSVRALSRWVLRRGWEFYSGVRVAKMVLFYTTLPPMVPSVCVTKRHVNGRSAEREGDVKVAYSQMAQWGTWQLQLRPRTRSL